MLAICNRAASLFYKGCTPTHSHIHSDPGTVNLVPLFPDNKLISFAEAFVLHFIDCCQGNEMFISIDAFGIM